MHKCEKHFLKLIRKELEKIIFYLQKVIKRRIFYEKEKPAAQYPYIINDSSGC